MKQIKILKTKKQHGIGLIEILVSILVLGVGALGVATMQLTGLKYNTGSQGRSQAILLANDMMDRMRSNRQFAETSLAYNTLGFEGAEGTDPPFNCYNVTCSPVQLAAFDQWYFLNQVQNLLPFGLAQISSVDNAGTRVYQISLQWRNVAGRQDREGITVDDADEISEFTFVSVL